MTDKEKLEALFTEFGIGYEPITEDYLCNNETGIWIGTGHNKVDGYVGFYTEFVFNGYSGKFKKVGIYE